ncbi:MAG TPA: TolC family protein, partial [Sphingobacterium sp.]|nr:TolC family protein [Sphingobacterium sp.]
FRIAQVHFEAGNSNSVLFLTAKNKLDSSQIQLLVKQYEWLLQKYINDYYAGALNL